jgi:hypothetical protein
VKPGHFYFLAIGAAIVAFSGVKTLGGWFWLFFAMGFLAFCAALVAEEGEKVKRLLNGDNSEYWGRILKCKHCNFITDPTLPVNPEEQLSVHVVENHGHGLHYLDAVKKSKKN